ncbi:MAG: vacuolar iron transporter family protein [Acidimicrobiaceae bacterium]|jgi:VIT1/CCC1 family predicted Fe2+/Mn2+ transporter
MHRSERSGWLRAAVLGADDGIVSVTSVAIGVIATGASSTAVFAAALAALVAGAMSMAAGEYVSVSSQRDTELGDLAQERDELAHDPAGESRELAAIYRQRGLSAGLADEVAAALMATDPLAAHARDELGLSETTRARPMQAALTSAASFILGGALPLVALVVASTALTSPALVVSAISALAILGAAGAKAGGAPIGRAALRVGVGGTLAIAVTAAVGHLFGAVAG